MWMASKPGDGTSSMYRWISQLETFIWRGCPSAMNTGRYPRFGVECGPCQLGNWPCNSNTHVKVSQTLELCTFCSHQFVGIRMQNGSTDVLVTASAGSRPESTLIHSFLWRVEVASTCVYVGGDAFFRPDLWVSMRGSKRKVIYWFLS
jgi:hypothetical protein